MSDEGAGSPFARPGAGILHLTIRDASALYAAYISYIPEGGLFIPTNKPYNLGDEIFMLLSLMDEAEKMPVAGKVIWVTPPGAEAGRIQGVGVQFTTSDSGKARARIEEYLTGRIEAEDPTHTM